MAVRHRFIASPLGAYLWMTGVLATSPLLTGADLEPWSKTSDWYLSVGIAPVPEIEEETSGAGGTSTYDWENLEGDFAPRLALGYMTCAGNGNNGWALGIEAVFTTCDVTPTRYQVGGLSFSNTSNRTLRYHTAGLMLSGGYQFGVIPDEEAIHAYLLLTPFVGIGAAYADSEVRDLNGTYESDSGIGWYLEGGLRAGFIFTERKWLGGVLVDLVYSSGEVDVDFNDGSSSTLVHERFGVAASLMVGYRL